MTKQTLKVELLGRKRSDYLPNEGIIKDCKEENGEFYYLVERKETGMVLRNWIHEDDVRILY